MHGLAFRPASDLAAALARGEVSARELVDRYLARIERYDGRVNAVVTLDGERARRRADEADAARARGGRWGPLHGLPITVKDQLDTAGLRTTCGVEEWAERVPEEDAEAVARLKAAGAIVLGKTNLPPRASDWQTANALFGRTRNPWDPERGVGGSSGGAAAAVAAGLSALDVGGDIGGSIRNPAHCCGVYGHKPSWGIVPTRGTRPGARRTPADIAVLGVLARSADDLELGVSVLAGPDEREAVAWRLSLPPPRHARLADYRVAVWSDDRRYPVDDAVRERIEAAAEALARAGAHVDPEARPALELANVVRLRQQLVYPLIAARLPADEFAAAAATARALAADRDDRPARWARFMTQAHVEWLRADERRQELRALWDAFFRDFDALLCPTSPVPAPPHDDRDVEERTIVVNGEERPWSDLGAWISLAGVALLPATVAPAGRTPAGLPVGVEIVGPYLEDRTPIDLARRLADLVGGFEPPPGFDD